MKPAYLPFTCYHNCLFIFYPQAKFDQVPIFYQKRINSFGSSCSASKTKTLCKLWNPSSWDVHKRCQPLAPPRPQQVLANRKSQGARTEVSKSRPELGVCAAAAQIKARDQSEDRSRKSRHDEHHVAPFQQSRDTLPLSSQMSLERFHSRHEPPLMLSW